MKRRRPLLLHIPHSSTFLPSLEGFLVEPERLESELVKLTDWHTDELYAHPEAVMVKAEFSRLFCDVERFSSDAREPMARVGMGMCYETFDDGRRMREVSAELRHHLYERYYRPHHQRLTAEVERQLQQWGCALIVDGHSFASTPFFRDRDQRKPRPDFNLGTSAYHTPPALVEAAVEYLQAEGYRVGVDWPYSGTMIPEAFFEKEVAVHSIMIEINRDLYLNSGTSERSAGFDSCRRVVQGLLEVLMEVALPRCGRVH
jgi:N-formylglutamate amidohydrolase